MRRALALAVLWATLAGLPASAAAAPARPVDLHVLGGDGWRAKPSFGIEWTNPATGGGPPLAAVHFRVRDQWGTPIAAGRLDWAATGLGLLTVPATPATYAAEVWLEDASGAQGAAATVTLRFDDERPARVASPPIPTWIGRAAFPLNVNLGPPLGPPPLSGIRGYAVALGPDSGATPCLAADRCSEAETTLRRGGGVDTLTIAALPDGVTHLSVATVSGSGVKSAAAARAVLRVDTIDPETRLGGLPTGWVNRSVTLTATASDATAGMSHTGAGPPPFTAIAIDGGAPTTAVGPSVSATVVTEGAHEVTYYARDAAGNVNDGGISNGQLNRPPATALVRIDREPPSVAFAAAQDAADPELIRARIADTLSSPSGSGWIGVRRAGSGDRFERLPDVPGVPGQLRARWDSDAHPAGEYEFRAVGYDGAGNSTATTQRADGTAMVLRNPLKQPTELSVDLTAPRFSSAAPFAPQRGKTRSGSELTVAYGATVRLRGQLTGGGAPLAGQAVRVVERFAAGGGAERVSTATTGPGGAFSLPLAPGPSREITASFAGSPTLSRTSASALAVGVASRVRLAASAATARVGGAPVNFRGRVVAPRGTLPAGGRSVQLQFRLPGLDWSEFRTVQTDRRGRFRYAYRFSDDDSRGVRFRFRAYVPAQDDWPYEPGGSRPIAVRGR